MDKLPRIRTDSAVDDSLTQPLLSPRSSSPELSIDPSIPPKKLSTVSGVFIPVFISIWRILFYIRFTIILGNVGVFGMLGMLCIGYLISTMTALSMSAISTNGRVRTGGAYFLISRCLGPEFGGAIGTVFYVGTVLSIAMNALGFVESLLILLPNLPSYPWYQTAYASTVLLFSAFISSMGSTFFARLNSILFSVIIISILSGVGSIIYSSNYPLSLLTLLSNLPFVHEQDVSLRVLFGIMFPACSGILAGASMSGDLENASKSIPRGTLWGIIATFCLYVSSILVFACAIPRHVLIQDSTILFAATRPHILFNAGLLSSALSGVFGGILSAAQLLEAMLVDRLYPGLKPVSITFAIIITYSLTQIVLFFIGNLNSLSPFYTQTILSTYGILNFACLLLILSGAPNFRPRFIYFGRFTAFFGMVLAFVAMFVVGVVYAAACLSVSVALFALVHYFGEPKNWGDVSHALMYRNVCRMLLKMDRQLGSQHFLHAANSRTTESSIHAKLWRPQILLAPPPHSQPTELSRTIRFANDLAKGSLFVLGKLELGSLRTIGSSNVLKISAEWAHELEKLGAKGFVQMAVDADARNGIGGMVLASGIGKVTPNIIMIPFPSTYVGKNSLQTHSGINSLCNFSRPSPTWDPRSLLGIIEDSLSLDKALAILRNFENNDTIYSASVMPSHRERLDGEGNVLFIDLWPMSLALPVCAPAKQSSLKSAFRSGNQRRPSLLRGFVSLPEDTQNSCTTVSDSDVFSSSLDDVATFTLILQLGYILSRRKCAKVRLFLLVESKEHKSKEKLHITNVLAELRMDDVIDLRVVCLEEEEELDGLDAGLALSTLDTEANDMLNVGSSNQYFGSIEHSDRNVHLTFSNEYQSNKKIPADRVLFKPPRKLFADPLTSSEILQASTIPTVRSSQEINNSSNSDFENNHTTWDEENVLAQAYVLQRVVAKYSGSFNGSQSRASVLLTTLPFYPNDPSGPAYVDAHVASKYVNVLDTLTLDWPPTVLVAASAGQFSVTSHL